MMKGSHTVGKALPGETCAMGAYLAAEAVPYDPCL
jgi:hypothetical protein